MGQESGEEGGKVTLQMCTVQIPEARLINVYLIVIESPRSNQAQSLNKHQKPTQDSATLVGQDCALMMCVVTGPDLTEGLVAVGPALLTCMP